MQNRLRSKTLWISIFSLVIFVSKTYFNYEIPRANELFDSLLLVMTLLGIFNNPTQSDKF